MGKAHNTEAGAPGGENISYNSISMNFAVQLIGVGLNSKKQKCKNYRIWL